MIAAGLCPLVSAISSHSFLSSQSSLLPLPLKAEGWSHGQDLETGPSFSSFRQSQDLLSRRSWGEVRWHTAGAWQFPVRGVQRTNRFTLCSTCFTIFKYHCHVHERIRLYIYKLNDSSSCPPGYNGNLATPLIKLLKWSHWWVKLFQTEKFSLSMETWSSMKWG